MFYNVDTPSNLLLCLQSLFTIYRHVMSPCCVSSRAWTASASASRGLTCDYAAVSTLRQQEREKAAVPVRSAYDSAFCRDSVINCRLDHLRYSLHAGPPLEQECPQSLDRRRLYGTR
jgi:hypothetical protein